jgi:hypothetical protein
MITAIGQISTIILDRKHPGYKAPGFIRGVNCRILQFFNLKSQISNLKSQLIYLSQSMITATGQISTIILDRKHPGYKAPGFIRGVNCPILQFFNLKSKI